MVDFDKDMEWLHNIDFGADIDLDDLDFDLPEDEEEIIIKEDPTEHFVVLDKSIINDNFKKWWRNSYCCNRKGEPIVVYHSTDAEFDAFKSELDGTANGRPVYGGGFCFSAYEEYTKDFGKKVMPCVLSIQNPIDLGLNPELDLKVTYKLKYKDNWQDLYNDPDHVSRGYLQDKCQDIVACFQMLNNEGYSFEQIMSAYGYDGIIDGHIFIVVKANQIKSINNKGTWSTTSDNIFESKKEKHMNIPQLLEKLKKFIIEPQEPFLDEMEDETGINKVEECMAAVASPSVGPAPTPAFSQVKVNDKAVDGKGKKKKKVEEEYTGDVYKVIKHFKDKEEELHNDVLFEGSKEECEKFAKGRNIKLVDYSNKKKPGLKPQYFIRGFENHKYKKHDPEVIKRNQSIITNSNIGEKYSLIHQINSLCEEINTSIDDVIIAWLDKLNFRNLKSEKGFIYKNSNGNFLHYIIFNKPNKVKYIIKNIDNQTIFSDEWQVADPEDTEELFRKTIGPKFDSFE